MADFDGNGTEDRLVANTLTGSNPGCQLFLNGDVAHHWIGFELEGVVSPRDAAGARVVVHADADFVRTDQSYLGHSYSSCSPLTFNFGLGDRTSVDSVEFFWPSGFRTVLEDPAVDQYHTSRRRLPGVVAGFGLPEPLSSVRAIRSFSPYRMGDRHVMDRGSDVAEGAPIRKGRHKPCSQPQRVYHIDRRVGDRGAGRPAHSGLEWPAEILFGHIASIDRPRATGGHPVVQRTDGGRIDPCRFRYPDRDHHHVCGHIDTSDPVVLSVFDSPLSPVVPPATVAIGGLHTFEPIVLDEAVLRWYAPYGPGALDDLLAGTTDQVGPFIIESPTYLTPPLGATTGWWVRSEIQRDVRAADGGKATSSSGGFINADTYGLQFDAHEPVVLEQVRMRADFAGPRTVQLTQPGLGVIASKTVQLVAGWNEVELGFDIAPGEDYGPLAEGEDIGLWRDNVSAELTYPYAVGELVTITGSTIPNAAGLGYYYFFYDWQVSSQGLTCTSLQLPPWSMWSTRLPVARMLLPPTLTPRPRSTMALVPLRGAWTPRRRISILTLRWTMEVVPSTVKVT